MTVETLNLILTLVFIGIFVFALIGGLVGLIKGIYKTTVKTIIKGVLVLIAVFVASPIASMLSTMDITNILKNFTEVEGSITLQSFIVNLLYEKLNISPINGMSIYETCILLANSIVAFVVFILELIIIQLFVSVISTIVYQCIIRWIIPVETKKEKKARLKAKKEGIISSGLEDEDGNVDGKKHRRKLHLYQWPGFLLGFAQQFVFVCILFMPLSSVCKIATKNKQLVTSVLSMTNSDNTELVDNIDGYLDCAAKSPLLSLVGVGDIDSKLISTATSVKSADGSKMDFLSLVNQVVDIASPTVEKGIISYDKALAKVTINLSALLSYETVDVLITQLIASPTVISLIPALIDVALNYVKGATLPIDQIDLKNINWGSINKDGTKEGELALISDIYKCIYSTAIEPMINKEENKFDFSRFSLKLSQLSQDDKNNLLQAFEDLGKMESVKRNMGILLSSVGSILNNSGFKLLSTNYEDYKEIDWGHDLKIIGGVIIDFFNLIGMDLTPNFKANEMLDKIIEAIKDPNKISTVVKLITGDNGLLSLQLFEKNCISIADLLDSAFNQIPSIQSYIGNVDFNYIFTEVIKTTDELRTEINSILDLAKSLFNDDSKISIDNLSSIDLKDQEVADQLASLLEKSRSSKIFESLFPSILKGLLFNDSINISSFLFGLSPYNFNYDDVDFIPSLSEIIKLLPSLVKMTDAFSDDGKTIDEKVESIDTSILKSLLNKVVNSKFFNSDQLTGETSNYQHNKNIATIINGLFNNDMFKQLNIKTPSNETLLNIDWGTGENDGKEIDRICKIFDDIKDMKLASLLSENDSISLDKLPAGKDISKLISDGMDSQLLSDSIVSLIDKSLNDYFKKIGIPLSLNEMRNFMWKEDSDSLGEIIDLLKKIDLDNFDINTLDVNIINCLLTRLYGTNIVRTSSDSEDPFGYLIFSILKNQKSLAEGYFNYSSFILENVKIDNYEKKWNKDITPIKVSIEGYTSTIDTDGKFTITGDGEIAYLCEFLDITKNKLTQGIVSLNEIIAPLFDRDTHLAFKSSVIRNIFLSICTDYQFNYDANQLPVEYKDFICSIDFEKIRHITDEDEFNNDVKFLGIIDDLLSDTDKTSNKKMITEMMENITQLKVNGVEKVISTDPESKYYNVTYICKLYEILDSIFESNLMQTVKAGHKLSPTQEFFKMIVDKLDAWNTVTLQDNNNIEKEAFDSILQTIDGQAEWTNECSVLKSLIEAIQGTNMDEVSDFDLTKLNGETVGGILNAANRSKALHKLPISIIKSLCNKIGVEQLTYSDGKKIHELPFEKYSSLEGDGSEAIAYWKHDIDLFVQLCFGDEQLLDATGNKIYKGVLEIIRDEDGGNGDLNNLKFDQLTTTFLYYLGSMNLFKDTRSYLAYNLMANYGSNDFKISQLFTTATNAPYGENKAVYRIEELLYNNQKLFDAQGKLDKEKAINDLLMLDDVFDYVLSSAELASKITSGDISQLDIDFEYMNNCCYKLSGNELYRCDFASEMVAGFETTLINNQNFSSYFSLLNIDLYTDDYKYINSIEGRFFNGMVKYITTTPQSYSYQFGSVSQNIPYYTKAQLQDIFDLLGNESPIYSNTPAVLPEPHSADYTDQSQYEEDYRKYLYSVKRYNHYSQYSPLHTYFKTLPLYSSSCNSKMANDLIDLIKLITVKDNSIQSPNNPIKTINDLITDIETTIQTQSYNSLYNTYINIQNIE